MLREATTKIPAHGGTVALGAGEMHFSELELESQEFVRLVVGQHGIDVALRLRNPEGEVTVEVDSPSGPYGSEELVAIALAKGGYRIEIEAAGTATDSGEYAVEALDRRPATADDRRWVEADQTYRDARSSLKARKYAEARDAFRSILATWQELELPHREAATREQLCSALLRSGKNLAAIDECEQAVAWFRALGERRRMANNLQNAATALLRLGHTDQAIERLEEAWPIFEEQNHRRGLSLCLSRLGFAYLIQGRPQEALAHLERGLKIAEELGRADLQASLLTDTGKALLTLHRSQEALERYSNAVVLYRQAGKSVGLEAALAGVASAAAQLGDLDHAEQTVKEAMDELGPEGEARVRAVLLFTLGHIQRLRGNKEQARAIFEQARTVAVASGELHIEADVLLNLGFVEVESGAPQRGLELHERAFELYERAGEVSGMVASRARAAQALRDQDRLEEAWERLKPALDDVEQLRAATGRRDHRLSFFTSYRQEYFEIARDVLLQLHDAAPEAGYDREAFTVDERRRARELLDSLAFQGVETSSADAELLAKERDLERALRDVASRGPSPETNRSTGRLIEKLHQLRAKLRRVPQAERSHSPVIDLDAAQKQLDDDTLLLVYSLGDEHSVLWAVTPDELRACSLQERQHLEAWARRFVDRLVQPSSRSQVRRAEAGRVLSGLLLEPVAELLDDRRLVIVADGELQTVPFAALPEPREEDDAFLVRRHQIVHLPSISALPALRRQDRERPEGRRIAAFADPVFAASDPRVRILNGSDARSAALVRSVAELRLGDPLSRLPESRQEAQKIVAMAAGTDHLLALGFEARREVFEQTDWGRFTILHMATHALLHPEPELSGLLLSLVDEQGSQQDGFLPAIEISRLYLPLELVVLSACETGVGKALRGEGALGLAWAFLDAGASRIVASLWKISDKRTADFMVMFYDSHLKRGLSPAAALRQAQLAMSERPGATPFDWAGFVIQGDWH